MRTREEIVADSCRPRGTEACILETLLDIRQLLLTLKQRDSLGLVELVLR